MVPLYVYIYFDIIYNTRDVTQYFLYSTGTTSHASTEIHMLIVAVTAPRENDIWLVLQNQQTVTSGLCAATKMTSGWCYRTNTVTSGLCAATKMTSGWCYSTNSQWPLAGATAPIMTSGCCYNTNNDLWLVLSVISVIGLVGNSNDCDCRRLV